MMQIDESAMKVIIDKLVDPWHRTFARDVVEMYLKHANNHPDDNSNNRTARKLEMHKIRSQNPETSY